MSGHGYQIIVNGGASKTVATYSFSSISNVTAAVNSSGVAISWKVRSGREYRPEELITTSIFYDSLQRAYLYFALKNGKGLKINKITIVIDETTATINPATPNFPFVTSLIPVKDLGINADWMELISELAGVPKGKQDTDKRYSSIYSFLSSTRQSFEINRFFNLWASMNVLCAEVSSKGSDRDQINGLLDKIYPGSEIATSEFRKGKLNKNIHPDKDPVEYKERSAKLYRRVGACLGGITDEEIEELHKGCLEGGLSEKYKPISDICYAIKSDSNKPISPYAFMLLEYSYYLRCNYIHGGKTMVLFTSKSDWKISAFRVANYFLHEFLALNIPRVVKGLDPALPTCEN